MLRGAKRKIIGADAKLGCLRNFNVAFCVANDNGKCLSDMEFQ